MYREELRMEKEKKILSIASGALKCHGEIISMQ
jgi:hypothetical protein